MAHYYEEIDPDRVKFELKTAHKTLKVFRVEPCIYSVVQETTQGWLELQVLEGFHEAKRWAFEAM